MRHRLISALLVCLTACCALSAWALCPVVFNCGGINDYGMVTPRPIKPGAKIAIITPSSAVDSLKLDSALRNITALGFQPVVMDHVFGSSYGKQTSPDSARAADIMRAFADPEIDAILCSRGGYGATRLLPLLDGDVIISNPKWLIGYSDISALHAYLQGLGMVSMHGPIGTDYAKTPLKEGCALLIEMLQQGPQHRYELQLDEHNKPGEATGMLIGGNLSVVDGSISTPYDIYDATDGKDVIIFLEDVDENIDSVERLLLRLHLNGVLQRAKGLVFGEFTDYEPEKHFQTMEDMIRTRLTDWGYYDKQDFPILYNFPAGHGNPNFPLPLGSKVTLTVTPEQSTLDIE